MTAQHVVRTSSSALTQVVVSVDPGSVMEIMTVEICLMNRTATVSLFCYFSKNNIHRYFTINGSTKLERYKNTHSHTHTDSNVSKSNSLCSRHIK